MKPTLAYDQGTRTFAAVTSPLSVVKLSSDIVLQTGSGVEKAKAGYYVVTLPSGQQFPLAPNIVDELLVPVA